MPSILKYVQYISILIVIADAVLHPPGLAALPILPDRAWRRDSLRPGPSAPAA